MKIPENTEAVHRFFVLPDGSLNASSSEGGADVPEPEGGREISRAEYRKLLDAMRAKHQEYRDRSSSEDRARTRADYDALRAASLPDGLARRLSGFQDETGV